MYNQESYEYDDAMDRFDYARWLDYIYNTDDVDIDSWIAEQEERGDPQDYEFDDDDAF